MPGWVVDEVRPLLPVGWAAATVAHHVARLIVDAGGSGGAHGLRHRYATQLLAGCHDLRVVQEALGHTSPATTAVYTLVDDDTASAGGLAAAYARCLHAV